MASDCKEEWLHMVRGSNDFEQQGFPDPEKEWNRTVNSCAEAYMIGFEFRKLQEEENEPRAA